MMHAFLRVLPVLFLLTPATSVYAHEDAAPALEVPPTAAIGGTWPFPPCPCLPDEVAEDDESGVETTRRCICGPNYEPKHPIINLQCIHVHCESDDWWTAARLRSYLCNTNGTLDLTTLVPSPDDPTPDPIHEAEAPPSLAAWFLHGPFRFFNVGVLSVALIEVFGQPWALPNGVPVDRSKNFYLAFGIVWGFASLLSWKLW